MSMNTEFELRSSVLLKHLACMITLFSCNHTRQTLIIPAVVCDRYLDTSCLSISMPPGNTERRPTLRVVEQHDIRCNSSSAHGNPKI